MPLLISRAGALEYLNYHNHYDFAFDQQTNLYVPDYEHHRIQMFNIDKSSSIKGTYQKVLLIE